MDASTNTQDYDVIIIGGGPAGMTAAIYAARANIQAIVLESAITGGLVNSTYTVENFPSWPSIHGMDLMEKMREHVDALHVPVEEVCEITRLELEGPCKRVHTEDVLYQAKAVILATGRCPIPLDVPTECEQVHHCAICDGAPYVGKKVLVVGGGNSAFDESLYMLHLGIAHITLVEAMPRYFAAKATQDELLSSGKVTGYTSTKVVDLVLRDGVLSGAILENVENGQQHTIAVDAVFVFLGQKPNNSLFAEQIALSEQGYILAGPDMQTTVAGVFSAGDITHKEYRQITTAVADGTIAALAVEKYIRNAKK